MKWQLEEEEIWSEGPPLGHRDEGAARRELCHGAHGRCCLQDVKLLIQAPDIGVLPQEFKV